MRIFILFYVFFISISGFKAQPSFNRAYHNASQIAAPFAMTINGSYYHIVIVKEALGEANQAFLYKHKNDSVLKFRKPIIQNVKLDINQAFVTNDKAILVISNDRVCNIYSYQGGNSYLLKLDTNGNQLFKTTVNRQFMFLPPGGDVGVYKIDKFKLGCQNNDSSYSIFTDSVMFKFSPQGAFISRKRIATDSITAALLLPNNNILINGHFGQTHALMVISPSGSVLSTFSFPSVLKKLVYYNGNKIMGLSANGNLYKITPNYGLIANTNFALSTKVTDFICVSDTIYSCRMAANASASYYVCDTSLNTIYNGAILSKSISPVAIARSNQKIIIVANHSSDNLNSLDPNYFSSINVFDKTSVPIHNFDIELSKLMVDTAYYSVMYTTMYNTAFNLQLRLKFYVKNKSNSAVKQFRLTCGTGFYSQNCGAGEFYQELFDGLNLLPGDSVQFTSGLITRFANLDNQGYSFPGIPQQHCVYLTVPNNEVDKDQSNNEQCVFENFHNLGLKANAALVGQVFIYPNPVNRFLKIESQIEMKSIRISDYLGRNIQEINADSKTIEIDTQALPKGIYFISVETESALITKKIIKE